MDNILILLSAYNGEEFLPKQIESLFKQKNVKCNILVRDDGSSDGTIRYLETLNDDRICFYKGKNKKTIGSFLELIENASLGYDYYAFSDQDDVWMEDKLECAVRQLNSLDKHKPSLYYSGQLITDRNLNILYEHFLAINRSVKACCIFNQLAGCTAVFNESLLKKLKEYSPTGLFAHDAWVYKVCAAFDGNIVVESRGHILYRQHGHNVVGLQSGIKGKLKRVIDYIFKYNASSYAKEILRGYSGQISSEWEDFFKTVANANKSLKSKIKLLISSQIVFRSVSLRIIFIIKLILSKL